jgi:hypothetical protein
MTLSDLGNAITEHNRRHDSRLGCSIDGTGDF